MATPFGPVQWISAQAGSSVASVTTAALTTTSGNLGVVGITCFGNHIGASPITDSKGNTWTAAIASTGASKGWGAIFYCANMTGGASHTFTFTPSANDALAIGFLEIVGADASPLNGTSSSTASTATHNSGNVTAGSTVELLVGFGAISSSGAGTPVIALPALVFAQLPDGTPEGLAFGAKFLASSAVGSFQYTTSIAENDFVGAASFKSAASGGGTTGGAWASA